MTDSSTAVAHRHVVFMPLCGASPLMSNCPWSSHPGKTKRKPRPDWAGVSCRTWGKNKEWGMSSLGERAEMSLLRLIQESRMSAGKTVQVTAGLCCWCLFWLNAGFRCAAVRMEVFVHECQCRGMFYIARSEVQRERERERGGDGWREEGGADRKRFTLKTFEKQLFF